MKTKTISETENLETKQLKIENMKTTLKQIATGTFILLLVLAGNVKSEGTELKASGLEITESSLQLENWMVRESIWNTSSFTNMDFALETEAIPEIESWMTSEAIWNVEEEIKEAELPLEDWMVNTEVWK